jgi:hypothetical protein
VTDRRLLMLAIPAVVLAVVFAYVALSIQSEKARQPEQYVAPSGGSQIKSTPNTTSSIGDGSSSGAQFRKETPLALEVQKERQDLTDCASPPGAVELPVRCTTLESDIELALNKRKQQEEVVKEKAERLGFPLNKERQEGTAAGEVVKRQALEAVTKQQEEATKLEVARLAREAEKTRQEEAAAKEEGRQAQERKQQEEAEEAERLALAVEKKNQEDRATKNEVERLALEAENKRQQDVAARNEAERLALESEKKRQQEAAAKNEVERLALEAEKKRQEEAAAKNEAERLAIESEKKQQEEAAAKNEAERLELEVEKQRQQEAAEGVALAADTKRQEELARLRPNPAGEVPATKETDQQTEIPKRPAAAPTGTPEPPVTAASLPVSSDLPVFAPSRVVLIYLRNDNAALERASALRQALAAANVEVVKLEAVDASRQMPGLGYYFRSDHDAAVEVSHRVKFLLGPVEPALLELRGRVPQPGTVEIAVPGRAAR